MWWHSAIFASGMGERISEMKGEEVKAFFFFPMRKAAAIANVNFAVTWLHGAVDVRGRIFLRHGAILLRLPERGRGRPRYSRPGGRRYIPGATEAWADAAAASVCGFRGLA